MAHVFDDITRTIGSTDGAVDFLVEGVGTGGTITGIAEVIKPRKPSFKDIAVEPARSAVISGGNPKPHRLHRIGAGFVPVNLNRAIVDDVIQVNEDDSGPVSRQVSQLDGIPVGISSGAIVPTCSERRLFSWLFAEIDVNSDTLESLGITA